MTKPKPTAQPAPQSPIRREHYSIDERVAKYVRAHLFAERPGKARAAANDAGLWFDESDVPMTYTKRLAALTDPREAAQFRTQHRHQLHEEELVIIRIRALVANGWASRTREEERAAEKAAKDAEAAERAARVEAMADRLQQEGQATERARYRALAEQRMGGAR